MKRVIVLGATGMVGSMVADVLRKSGDLDVHVSTRSNHTATNTHYVGAHSDLTSLGAALYGCDYAINCIGTIKPYIKDDDHTSVHSAVEINSQFPRKLALAASQVWERDDPTRTCRVLNIATDCVYSGEAGDYTEKDAHDPHDVYGKTKSLGEVHSPHFHNLRTSVIGHELKNHKSMLDWFLSNPDESTVNGYLHHEWNGITTLAYAKICLGIIQNDTPLGHLQHVIPKDKLNKRDLLRMINDIYKRKIHVKTDAREWLDRTLATENSDANDTLWLEAGYDGPQTIEEMVTEMAGYKVGV